MSTLTRITTRGREAVLDRCSIDTRSLAVFRMLMGVLVVADVVTRLARFSFFYTESGVVPQALAIERTPDGAFSFYFFTTDSTATAVLFALQVVVGVLLIIGYQTRVMAVLAFLLVISLSHRNPFVLSYADRLFRLLMFWAMFLPMGERWSVDAVHTDRRSRPRVAGLAAAAALLQMVYMYLANGLQKRSGGMWSDGGAVPIIFGLDDMTYPVGDWMRAFPAALEWGGVIWYWMLLCSPLLLVLRGRWRLPLVAMFLVGHLAFAVTVRIGSFAFVAIAGLLLFLPAEAWSDARSVVRALGLEAPLVAARRWARAAGHHLARPLPHLGPRTPLDGLRRAGTLLVALSILVVLVIPAVDAMDDADGPSPLPASLRERTGDVAAMLGVRQPPWTVFAPRPRRVDRWYVFAAVTADGDEWDVYNDRPLSFDRPHRQLQRQYRTYRERFYLNSVRRSRGGAVSRHLADYLCDRPHPESGERYAEITFHAIAETVTRDTIDAPDEREQSVEVIFRHRCIPPPEQGD